MSSNLNYRDVEYRVKVGDRVKLTLTMTDYTGAALDLSNTTSYSTGKWKVWKPDGTLVVNGDITFETRASGIVSYTLTAADTTLANAGIWEGEVEIKSTSDVITEQSRTFNFVIEESY
jgi:hypothetical protein